MSKDYYKILGVDKSASQDEIKKAFRKLAHQHHPDKSGGDEAKFKEANEAYTVLSDTQKRAQYDQFGSGAFNGGFGGPGAGQGGFGGFEGFDFSGFGFGGNGQGQNGNSFEFDLGDIFGSMFGGGGSRGRGRGAGGKPRGADIQVDIDLSFKDSIFGLEKEIHLTKNAICEHCKGNRAEPGTDLETCRTCNGDGKIIRQQRTILGTIENVIVCDECHGSGKIPKTKCKVCKGKGVEMKKENLRVVVPPGIENGETLRVKSAGEAIAGGEAGDLYIKIHVRADHIFRKQGYDLHADLPISIPIAVLGGEAAFANLDEHLTVKIPAGVQHGEILRVRGKGVPQGGSKAGETSKHRGDLMLKILIKIPTKLSKEQRKLYEELNNKE